MVLSRWRKRPRLQSVGLDSRKNLRMKMSRPGVVNISRDSKSVDPWKPRAIKVYGTAEVLDHQGRFGPGKYLRVTPKISWSFGIPGLKAEDPGWGRVKTVHR